MSYPLFQEKDPFAPIHYAYEIEEIICRRQTKFQELVVFRNPYFGKVMALDGVVQLTERDEFFYHEMLVQVPMHAHPAPKDVLIIGGGDGGTLREVLKHDMVESATLVDLDGGVIEASKEFFPTLSTGFSDPRARVLETEGAAFLEQSENRYDLIIVDSTDPVGPACSLFAESFFGSAFTALKNDGIYVAQTESLHFHREFVREVQQSLKKVFNIVDLYTVPLTTYAGNWWTFSIASKVHNPKDIRRNCETGTKYYSEDVHRYAFLPPSLYQRLME